MNKLAGLAVLAVIGCGAAIAAPGTKGAGSVKPAPAVMDIAHRKEAADQNLQKRIAQIEKRYAEDQSFRVKMKDKKIGLEKKLAQDYKSFLDSLASVKPEQRKDAWQSFIKSQRQKRGDFKTLLRADAKKYFQSKAPSHPAAATQ